MRPTAWTRAWLLLLLLVLAAAAPIGCVVADNTEPGPEAIDRSLPVVLEVHALDLWGQPLPPTELELTISRDGQPIEHDGSGLARIGLGTAASFTIELSAPYHHPLSVRASYDGSHQLRGLLAEADGAVPGSGLSVAHEVRPGELAHVLYLGLRHKWFSAQARPARRDNRLDLFVDGESGWGSVRQDIDGARDSVLISTWWWESDFELTRPLATHHLLTPDQRWANTILGVLEHAPAHKRILVGQFWGQDSILSWLTTDSELRAHAEQPGDGFELMGQANPTSGSFWFEPSTFVFGDRMRAAWPNDSHYETELPIASNVPGRQVDLTQWPVDVDVPHASYHQKFMVMDGQVAYVGGMNLRRVDWDTAEHRVYDHRRMLFDASAADRLAVMDREKLPDMGPRKDYLMRIEGPTAQDVAEVFHARWEHQRQSQVTYAAESTPFEVRRDIAPVPGGVQAQVTTTLPEPFWEHGIAESWFNAVDNAERYIFIEDQYFRSPMLNERIEARMDQVPDLRLVVITKPINEWTDPGCAQTYLADQHFRGRYPDRYLVLQLESFDYRETWGWDETEGTFVNMDTHSKMLIVDDLFMSVGSANKNNRGITYEGEMNVAVLDADWVREQRRRIFAGILPASMTATDDVALWWNQLQAAANHNDAVVQAWDAEGGDINLNGAPLPYGYAPSGLVYSLPMGNLANCVMESVGPDMTGVDHGTTAL